MKKSFTINLQDNPEYISFLTKLTEILKNINIAKDKGINVIFYQDEDIYQGKGEYTPLIFEALHAVGCKCDAERTFLGSGLYISWESDMKARIIEQTIKCGNRNQIIKYTIKGCETEKVMVNSSGGYVFGDKSFSKQNN